MGTCSRIATMLDVDMLAQNGATIGPLSTPDSKLGVPTQIQLTQQLGRRYLLRYLLPFQVVYFANGTSGLPTSFVSKTHYVTPTPFSPEEAAAWLALPVPDQLRPYVVLLDPRLIPHTVKVAGPRWVRWGGGIEYVLDSFPTNAVVNIGTGHGTQWPLLVT